METERVVGRPGLSDSPRLQPLFPFIQFPKQLMGWERNTTRKPPHLVSGFFSPATSFILLCMGKCYITPFVVLHIKSWSRMCLSEGLGWGPWSFPYKLQVQGIVLGEGLSRKHDIAPQHHLPQICQILRFEVPLTL